ncbi:hypothetical protein LB505_005589 [Fusarium chuoi]|nr:hypothetical protein LB505_005589 [Fusarium chuoi]
MSTTPLDPSKRSNSRSRTSRPTTPLRPSSRSSFRESARGAGEHDAPFPLNAFEPAFAELSDAMADLEANMMHFQLMHERTCSRILPQRQNSTGTTRRDPIEIRG